MNERHLSVDLDSPIIQSESLCASAGLCRPNAMRTPKSISRAKEETSQIQRAARTSDVASPTRSDIGQWQSSFQKGLPFEEVNAVQIHHHADKLSTRLLVYALRQFDCSHLHTAPAQCHDTVSDHDCSSLKRLPKRVFGKPGNRTPAVVIVAFFDLSPSTRHVIRSLQVLSGSERAAQLAMRRLGRNAGESAP